MSNRFHNKFHRQNHHSKRTVKNNTYTDAGYDPIASFEVPFQGEFFSEGDILTTENLSAQKGVFSESLTTKSNVQVGNDLLVQGSGIFNTNLTIKQSLSAVGNSTLDANVFVKQNLNVSGDTTIDGNLVLSGNLTVLGSAVQLETIVASSSAITITNLGTGPALTVTQYGTQPIAHFIDANGEDIIFDDNGYVGLGTNSPNEKLTIVGNISSTQNLYLDSDAQIGNNLTVSQNISTNGSINISSFANGTTNDVVTKDSNNTLETREINSRVWDTSANFLSGSLAQHYLPKFDTESTLVNSVIYNNGINVGINTSSPNETLTIIGNLSAKGHLYITGSEFLSGNLTLTQNISSSGTATIGTIPIGSTNNIVTKNSNNTLETRETNSRIWDTNANFLSGGLTQNKLPKFDSNSSLKDSLIYDDGIFVGINTTSPTDTFTVQGSSKFFGNVTIFGDLTATGVSTFANTVFSTTSALSVVHVGSGPAAWIGNDGTGDIASFYDIDQNIEVLHIGGNNSAFPNVGVKTSTPNKDFTVKGELSSSGTVYDATGNSANWNSVYSSVTPVSSNWSSVYSSVASTSGDWNSVYSSVVNTSANWNSTYSSVNSVSGNWQNVYNLVAPASASWNSVYSSVASVSASWNSVYSSVNSVSANWQNTYTNYSANSASYATTSTVNAVSSQLVLATDFNAYKTDVASATATLLPTSVYQSASGVWQNTYNTVQTNSASNWDNASVTSYVDNNFLSLTGGTISGNLSVLGSVAYLDTTVAVTSSMYIDTETTETALRITQRGTGNALVIEDSSNPDSTPFTITSDGRVGIGTDTPISKLNIIEENENAFRISNNSTHEYYASFGCVLSAGYFTAGSALVRDVPLIFRTSSAGAEAERVRFAADGKVGIGTQSPNENLTVVGNISSTGSILLSSGNSDNWNSVYTNVQDNSASYIKTDITNVTPGLSAITKLVAVSAIPLVQEIGTMYVLI